MRSPYVLTVDIGTSSVRALLFDRDGNTRPEYQVAIAHDVETTADGGAELNADEVLANALTCATQVAGRAVTLDIAGVAVCTFWHSILGIDMRGHAITPIYLWADTRSTREVIELRERLDERAIHARTGCVFHTSYLPARLLWISRHQPERFRSVMHWVSVGEYLGVRLFGERACSLSMASGTGLFDTHRTMWDPEMLAVCRLSPDQLSPLVDLDEPMQGMVAGEAASLGRLAELPWFPAVGDGACSNVGCGCVDPGRLALMVGTSGAMRVMHAGVSDPPPWGVWCYRADRHRLLLGGALSNGGNLVAWLRQTLRLPKGDALEQAVASLPPAGHGLTFLPFLAGERSPGWAAHARGTLHGLQWHTRPIDLYRSGLEAVALRFLRVHQLLGDVLTGEEQVIATGGGLLSSPTWMQIMADALGREVVASLEPEASSRGAALFALEALGVLSDIGDAPMRLGTRFIPNAEHHQHYLQAAEEQANLYRVLV